MKGKAKKPRTAPTVESPPRRETILVADDDPLFRSEFRDCFGEYDIIECASAEEAIRLLAEPNEIDLVILDVRMGGMSGLDALLKIRDASPEAGIIIVTGHGTKDVVIRALRGAADNYIEKPFDIDATRAIIEQTLEKRSGGDRSGGAGVPESIGKVMRFIRRNYLKRVGLRDAARVACLSPKYLSRLFREHTGVGFGDYKIGLKMERAKALLAESDQTVDQISYTLGYENAESFIRQFKKLTGATPSQYRGALRKRRARR
jgi:YesN/AraC family two-component response regulator